MQPKLINEDNMKKVVTLLALAMSLEANAIPLEEYVKYNWGTDQD